MHRVRAPLIFLHSLAGGEGGFFSSLREANNDNVACGFFLFGFFLPILVLS